MGARERREGGREGREENSTSEIMTTLLRALG